MQNRLLGIHMIVQNEEQQLPRCLNSLNLPGIQWFITDTGSGDRTPEIARQFGATVLHAQWDNHFARARNISLPLAGTEWILCVDADECAIDGLEELMDYLPTVHKSVSKLKVTIENRIDEKTESQVVFQPVRLFRSGYGYRYEGRIHEQLVCDDTEKVRQESDPLAPLRLVHDGYLASQIAHGHKPSRNFKLLQQELNEHPDQPFHLYNLGVTYCQLGQIEKAADTFASSLHLTEFRAPYRPTLVRDYAKVLGALDRYDEGRALLAVETQHYPDYADLHFLYGDFLEQQGLEERAYQFYAKAVDKSGGVHRESDYVNEQGTDTYRPYTAMARLAQKRGFLQESAHLYGLALDHMSVYTPALQGLADVLQQSGESDEVIAEALLLRWKKRLNLREQDYAGEGTDEIRNMAHTLASCGAYGQALVLLQDLDQNVQIDPAVQLHWMLCASRCPEAVQLAEQLWGEREGIVEPVLPEQRLDWAIACWASGSGLSPAFLESSEQEDREVWGTMDTWFRGQQEQAWSPVRQSEVRLPEALQASAPNLIRDIVQRSVQTGQLTLAWQWFEKWVDGCTEKDQRMEFSRWLAGILYRQGYTRAAADLLIGCMTEGNLDEEGYFYLGEALFAKGHYDQAVSLFQQALERDAGSHRARAGSAISYLYLALGVIQKELSRSPSNPGLIADQAALLQRLRTAEGIPWRTDWHARERRNQLAEQPHFAMHDR
ncbi:glycosyltransferase [Paenibacillus sp. ACRRY]|uniref:glycosyltransferase n=1 Tax=Paenibacillus sp. ACRRY TaxID=2918208 RepID=UPI001EF65CE2|nr:glycosyltransferase [Paenibacillus sp. ACRRY]MCG7383845.1 glycosyltransferase [Paenibacillus sp. ACRRY]